jgi:hypothetical protein
LRCDACDSFALSIWQKAQKTIQSGELQGFKYFERLFPLLRRLNVPVLLPIDRTAGPS